MCIHTFASTSHHSSEVSYSLFKKSLVPLLLTILRSLSYLASKTFPQSQILGPKNITICWRVCGYKTLGSSYLNQQNPSDIDPFGITYMQVKYHPRNLLGLQETSFYSIEGMGDDHPCHSYLFVMCSLFWYFLSLGYLLNSNRCYHCTLDCNINQLL
jgi:hypothetical protein